MGELERVPEETIRAFSTRRQSLLEHMQQLGTEGFAAARVAALATREVKEQVDLPRLREDWRARAAEHGLGRRELESLVAERSRSHDRIEREQVAARLLGPDGLTARQTTFTMPELVCAVAGSLTEGTSIEQVLETVEELSRFPGVELVEPSGGPGRPARFTTRELLAVEREALELALAGRDTQAPRPDERILLRTLIESRTLSNEQRHLVRAASLSPDRVVCVVGVAGAGKTAALGALADAYRGSDISVLGAAPSGRAADELAAASGIPSRTIHRLLLDAQFEGGLPRGCLLVVDEAGMAETRVLAPMLRLVEQAEGKALLVGDPGQLPAVGAGGLYAALCEQLGTITLAANRRQRELPEREALARLRAGDPEPYLAFAAKRGRLDVSNDPLAAKQRLLEDWWQTARRDGARNVMLAYRRDDVRDLNQAAHALMLESGLLGPGAVTLGACEFRVGDRVICRRNDVRLGVRNGTRGSIVDLDRSTFTLRDDSGAARRLPLTYAAEHLDHAYALTGHAAQGATFERAYVLLHERGALREWGYVACSRARTETRLYLAERAIERETHGREPSTRTPSERAAKALSRSSAELLAGESQGVPRDPSTGALTELRRHTERARMRAQQRLAEAEFKLERLGWRHRANRRAQLRAEIAFHRVALRTADERLADLVTAQVPEPPRMPRESRALERTRIRQVAREREVPGIDLGR